MQRLNKNYMAQRLLTIIRLDTLRLYERIRYRKKEYLLDLAFKHTREPLKEVFKNRYEAMTAQELYEYEEELIIALDQFYSHVDDLKWYLFHTEELPGSIEVKVDRKLKDIEATYETLCLYLNATLDTISEQNEELKL